MKMKIFLGYAAFAPWIGMILAMQLALLLDPAGFMQLASMGTFVCIPVTALFAFLPLRGKVRRPELAIASGVVGANAHMCFYWAVLWLSHGMVEIETFAWVLTLSLAFTGAALLLAWDAEMGRLAGHRG
jgi:hypothetical protein